MSHSPRTPHRLAAALPAMAAAAMSLPAAPAAAQPTIGWHTTGLGGGASSGGGYALTATAGQTSAGPAMTGGGYTLTGGFWPGVVLGGGGPACPADWNGDGAVNSNDISAFLSTWLADIADGTANADFDGSGQTNSNDISAFLAAWLASLGGC